MLFRILAAFAFLLLLAPARAKPPPRVYRQQVPAALRANLRLSQSAPLWGMRVGSHLVYVYQAAAAGDKAGTWLVIWRRNSVRGPWRLRRRVLVSFITPESLSAWNDGYSARLRTFWLLPRKETGLILEARAGCSSTFLVFPSGFDGPVYSWSGGSDDGECVRSSYQAGPFDARGYRVLKGRYQWSVPVAQGKPLEIVLEWNQYWTGTGWTREGPSRVLRER